MIALLSVSYGSDEARRVVTLPDGLSPFIGMQICTASGSYFSVRGVCWNVDSPNQSDDPAVILDLSDGTDGQLDANPNGGLIFKELCRELAAEESGWKIPANILV